MAYQHAGLGIVVADHRPGAQPLPEPRGAITLAKGLKITPSLVTMTTPTRAGAMPIVAIGALGLAGFLVYRHIKKRKKR